jgi:hypothetical protein
MSMTTIQPRQGLELLEAGRASSICNIIQPSTIPISHNTQDGTWTEDVSTGDREEDCQGALQLQRQQERRCHGEQSALPSATRRRNRNTR